MTALSDKRMGGESVNRKKSTDESIVRETIAGNTDAYGILVSRYKNKVYSVALSITSDPYIAEDIAQESFIDAYMQLSRLTEPAKFSAWICGIARKKSLHHVSRRRYFDNIDGMEKTLFSHDLTPDDVLIRKENVLAVRNALSRLSEKNRVTAEMFYLGGLDIASVAKRLSLPVGTVKSRLHEARSKLKGELSHMYEKTTLSPDFDTELRARINEIKCYYCENGNDTTYDRMCADTEKFILAQPDERKRNYALADFYRGNFSRTKNDTVLDAAEKGSNGNVIASVIIDEIVEGDDYENWIRRIDEEALPKLEGMDAGQGKGQLLFWRGRAKLALKRIEEAIEDFREARRLCPPWDEYNALANAAIKEYEFLSENAENPYCGFNVTAEQYMKNENSVVYISEPGFVCNDVFSHLHKYDKFGFYLGCNFNCIFFDTSMTVGETRTAKDGISKMTLVSYNDSVTTAAGTFSDCLHVAISVGNSYDTEAWYANGIGLVKAVFRDNSSDTPEEYLLSDYTVMGGTGYYPFAEGNRWRYVNPAIPDYLCSLYENEITWTDGKVANLSNVCATSYKKGYLAEFAEDSDILIDKAAELASEWKLDEALGCLRRAVAANTSQSAAVCALGAIEYMERAREWQKKGYRFCPGSYNANYLIAKDNMILYDERGLYCIDTCRWGTRHEENRIFGVKPFRYLQDIAGCVWNKAWVPGYTETLPPDYENISAVLTVGEGGTVATPAGTFENCLLVTIEKEVPKGESYFFGYVDCGKKEFCFAPGVGIVRFDFEWGDSLASSAELVSYSNPTKSDSYLPLSLRSAWEYDEVNLTREGYRAKRIINVAAGMSGRYLINDTQDFVYLGTEEEYESFKALLR